MEFNIYKSRRGKNNYISLSASARLHITEEIAKELSIKKDDRFTIAKNKDSNDNAIYLFRSPEGYKVVVNEQKVIWYSIYIKGAKKALKLEDGWYKYSVYKNNEYDGIKLEKYDGLL